MSLSSKIQTLSSLLAALLSTQHTWKRMICVMWYRVFNMISVTKGANRRRLWMADLQILLDGWIDTYGINCNYKVYKENDIIPCNSLSGAGVPQSVLRQGHGLQVRGWNPGMGKDFSFLPNIQTGCGANPAPNQFAPCYIHGGKNTGTWCWPMISIYRRGYEWVEL